MADFIGGIRRIGPAYPVKPVQPAEKDKETDNRGNKRRRPDGEKRDDDSDKPHIDEHV